MPLKVDREFILDILKAVDRMPPKVCQILEESKSADRLPPILLEEVASFFLFKDNWALGNMQKSFLERLHLMFGKCQYLDWLLYLTRKRYRDHSQHQFYTGVLGWFFLNTQLQDRMLKQYLTNRMLRQYLTEIKKKDTNGNIIEKGWWIASLLHDHAYPLVHLLSIMPAIGFRADPDRLKSLLSLYDDLYGIEIIEMIEVLCDEPAQNHAQLLRDELTKYLSCFFDRKELEKLVMDNNLYNHGVWSAANLVAQIYEVQAPYFSKSKTGKYCFSEGLTNGYKKGLESIRQAVRAIAIHDCGCYSCVDIGKDPIAFLLLLCDEIQEWDRLTMRESEVAVEAKFVKLSGIDSLLLFSVGLKYQTGLNNKNTLNGLIKEFHKNGSSLSKNATVSIQETDAEWRIDDKGSKRVYTVRREEGKLNIYDSLKGFTNFTIDMEFCYEAEALVRTKWDYEKYFESKKKALKRLEVPEDFPIHHIEFQVSIIPYGINLTEP